MSVIKDILLLLETAVGPLVELINTLKSSNDENELRKHLDAYKKNKPDIRKEIQDILDKYGK